MWSVLGSFLNPKRCKNDNGIKSIFYEGSVFEDDAGIADQHFPQLLGQLMGVSKKNFTSEIIALPEIKSGCQILSITV